MVKLAETQISARIESTEVRVQQLVDLAAHTLVRDVGIILYLGFPQYFFRQDAAFKSSAAGGPSPNVDMPLAAARSVVADRIAKRQQIRPDDFVRSFWSTFNKHDYNQIHTPLLAILHELGIPADFVDVGANVGDTALAAAEAIATLGLVSHVHSFEPGPVFELTRANVSLNRLDRLVTVHNLAASDESGFVPMQILIGHTESGSIGGISAHYDLPLGETRFVQGVRLDEFLPNDGRPYLLKIDAEGVDFAVVRGSQGLIDSHRAPIITLEFTPKYCSPEDLKTARDLLQKYALFNLRGLDAAAHFDRFDLVPPETFDSWAKAVAASPHGWVDVVYISHEVVKSAPMVAFLERYQASSSAYAGA